jgi:hypothetical protein
VGARDRGSVGSFDGAGYDEPAPMLLQNLLQGCITPKLLPCCLSPATVVDASLLVGRALL